MQVEGGVLHINKGSVEPSQPDDLDDLRVGDAADMRAEREAAFVQDALHPILLHSLLAYQSKVSGYGFCGGNPS